MTFEEVTAYVESLAGRHVEVSVFGHVGGPTVAISGVASALRTYPIGPGGRDGNRYFCQVGPEPHNGFHLTPQGFRHAGVDVVDPETDGVWIGYESGSIVIEDERLRAGTLVLPLPPR